MGLSAISLFGMHLCMNFLCLNEKIMQHAVKESSLIKQSLFAYFSAFIRHRNENKGINLRCQLPIPDLGGSNSSNNDIQADNSTGEQQLAFNNRDRECVICMDNPRDCVLHPCHHLCTCINCGRLLLKRSDFCPICRRTITNAFRVYHS